MDNIVLNTIARIRSGFPEKFGIPRQSNLATKLKGEIVFESEFRNPEAVRGLEGFDYIWIIWGFSANRTEADKWRPTVRPPRLGGNTRMGVFATRSPYRPNPIGLSSVRLEKIDFDRPDGPVLIVSGADLMDGTPIYDIKPYLEYADSHSSIACGFTDSVEKKTLKVSFPDTHDIDIETIESIREILTLDPRPSYQNDPEKVYGLTFSGYEIKFRVCDDRLIVESLSNC